MIYPYRFGRIAHIVGDMTEEDDLLQDAIIDQLNAELAIRSYSMKRLAETLGKPYDSTRDYLKKEAPMRLGFFVEVCGALGISPDEVIRRAAQRLA